MLWVCSAHLWEREDAGTSLGAWSGQTRIWLPPPRPEGLTIRDSHELASAPAPTRVTVHSATRPSSKSVGGEWRLWLGSSKPPALWTPCPEHIKGGPGQRKMPGLHCPVGQLQGTRTCLYLEPSMAWARACLEAQRVWAVQVGGHCPWLWVWGPYLGCSGRDQSVSLSVVILGVPTQEALEGSWCPSHRW